MTYKKPQSPIMSGTDGIYPLTTADQVIKADGSRLEQGGKITADDSAKLGGQTLAQILLDYVYPVGSVYISTASTSPASLFGGTWEQLKDRFLLGAGDSYAAGSLGGYEYVRQVSYLPPINTNASQAANNNYLKSVIPQIDQYLKPTSRNTAKVTNIADAAGQPGTDAELTIGTEASYYTYESLNMPPYLSVYVWKRVS